MLYSTLLIDFFLGYHYCVLQMRSNKAQLIYISANYSHGHGDTDEYRYINKTIELYGIKGVVVIMVS